MKKLVPILFFLVLVHVSYAEDTITAGLLALDERVEIKKNIVQFSDNGKLDKSDESYLDTLLEKAKESKCLNSMLQLVKGLILQQLFFMNHFMEVNKLIVGDIYLVLKQKEYLLKLCILLQKKEVLQL